MLGPVGLSGFMLAQLDLQGPEKVRFGSWVCKNARRFLVEAGVHTSSAFLADAGRFSGFSAFGWFWRAPVPWNGDLSRRLRDLRLNGRLTP